MQHTPKKIMVIGSSGQLGQNLCQELTGRFEVVAVARNDLDLTRSDLVRQSISAVNPDILINAAAYTQVDAAEDHRDLVFQINATAPQIMAETAKDLDIPFIQYSTDYVFDGTFSRPYVESDAPNPINVYGESKLCCEEAVLKANPRAIVIRTSWVYSCVGKNFYLTMLRLGQGGKTIRVVDDQIGAPTTTAAITAATERVLQVLEESPSRNFGGVYHFTCTGETSWFGFAREIFVQKNLKVELLPIPTSDYPTPAKRPKYSVLNCQKICSVFGVTQPNWKDALASLIQSPAF